MKLFRWRRPYLNIVGHKYVWFSISAIIFVVALVSLLTRGLNFGIEFTGGTELDIQCKPGTTIAQVRSATAKIGYGNAQIQSAKGDQFLIRTPKIDDAKRAELTESLKANAGLAKVLGVNDVGPGWGAQVSRQAIIALAVFIVLVLLYISIRFEFKMAVITIIEILHDFVITIGVYSLVGRQVTPATVIAVLTILGYSLYDTIVIFDRIKENTDQLTRQSKRTYAETVNDSVNQVLTRSINTSLTTLIPIVAIMLFGGETLKDFAFALFLGVLSGTYSSIILAPPIVAMWKETEPKYRAYKERVDRKKARETVLEPGVAPAAKKAAVGTPAAKKTARPKPAPARSSIAEKPVTAAKKAEAPKPKPKPAAKAASTGKSGAAKARTKGPGSGKKKKKKKR